MPIHKDDEAGQSARITVSREPKGPANASNGAATLGDQAFRDAVMIVVGAWIVVLFLVWSLRSSNI